MLGVDFRSDALTEQIARKAEVSVFFPAHSDGERRNNSALERDTECIYVRVRVRFQGFTTLKLI